MNTAAIPNLYVIVWTCKSEFPQGNFLNSLTEPEINRPKPFEPTDIEYDRIRDEIARMEHVDYSTSIRINVMNFDDIEDFANL